VSRGTWVPCPESLAHFAYRAITFYGEPFQVLWLCAKLVTPRHIRNCVWQDPTTPNIQRFRAITYIRFGLFPFRSPLLWESRLLSFPEVTKMSQFTPFAPASYIFRSRYPGITRHGLPHSEISGSKPVWRLPEAYRSLQRPSSPLGAKASTVCPS
jgi:hypothetical protein